MSNNSNPAPVSRPDTEVIGFDRDGNEILAITANSGNSLDVLPQIGIDLSFDPDNLHEEIQKEMDKMAKLLKQQIAVLMEQAKVEADKAVQAWIATHPIEHAEMLYKQSVNAVTQARAELASRENELSAVKNSNECLTLISPEKHHYSQAFAGTFGPRTFDVANREDLDILLGAEGDKALALLIMVREDWFSGITDVSLANKVYASMKSLYKATEEARDNFIRAPQNVAEKERQVSDARDNLSQKEAESLAAEQQSNDLKNSVDELNNTLKEAEAKAVKDSVKFTADFYKELFNTYGEKAEKLASELAEQAKGKKIRNAEDAAKAWEKYKSSINGKMSAKDREAIVKWLESIDVKVAAHNFKLFSKGLGYVGPAIDGYELFFEVLPKSIKTDDWRPFFVKVETIGAGLGAAAIVALTFSILVSNPIGLIGYALIMAAISAVIDDGLVERFNKLIGI